MPADLHNIDGATPQRDRAELKSLMDGHTTRKSFDPATGLHHVQVVHRDGRVLGECRNTSQHDAAEAAYNHVLRPYGLSAEFREPTPDESLAALDAKLREMILTDGCDDYIRNVAEQRCRRAQRGEMSRSATLDKLIAAAKSVGLRVDLEEYAWVPGDDEEGSTMNDETNSLVARANSDMNAEEDAIAGGREAADAVLSWAARNLSLADRQAYKVALDDPNTHREAFRELMNRRAEAMPAKPFASKDEYVAAVRRQAATDVPDVEFNKRLAATSIETLHAWGD